MRSTLKPPPQVPCDGCGRTLGAVIHVPEMFPGLPYMSVTEHRRVRRSRTTTGHLGWNESVQFGRIVTTEHDLPHEYRCPGCGAVRVVDVATANAIVWGAA